MENKKYVFNVITPIIMMGAERNSELRVPSIKGVIRFWFRALMGCFIDNTKDLYTLESDIFGSTEKKSNVILKLNCIPETEKIKNIDYENFKYFLFPYRQRINERKNERKNEIRWIKEGSNFEIECFFKNNIYESILCETFELISLFGGFGARNRRGFGSVCLKNLEISNENAFINKFKEIINVYKNYSSNKNLNIDKQRDYSCFLNGKIAILNKNNDNYIEQMKFIQKVWQDYRRTNPLSERINLGLPIIKYNNKRRASPIIFKIFKKGDNYLIIILFLNSTKLYKTESDEKILNEEIINKFFDFLINNSFNIYNINTILQEACR